MKELLMSIILGVCCAAEVMATEAVTDEVLIFAFFRKNGQDGMYLASSEDGIHFTPLNNDEPVMKPAPWPGQQLVRDPQIIFHDGKFHAAWTSAWKGNCFGYAESTDLVTWSDPIKVQPFSASQPQPRSTWFSWICWDPIQANFIITWSSDARHLYIMRTANWKTFTEPKRLLPQPFACLDGDMVLDDEGKRWVMTIKNEDPQAKGGKNLMVATCPVDFGKPWDLYPKPIIGPGTGIQPETMVEGGCLLKQKDCWFLYWDAPQANPPAYGLASSVDLIAWTNRSAELQMPKDRRHGNISRVPRAAVGWLKHVSPTNSLENQAGEN